MPSRYLSIYMKIGTIIGRTKFILWSIQLSLKVLKLKKKRGDASCSIYSNGSRKKFSNVQVFDTKLCLPWMHLHKSGVVSVVAGMMFL